MTDGKRFIGLEHDERRARWGDDVPEGFLRISVGCEPFELLWDAIKVSL